MQGLLPPLWLKKGNKIIGPNLINNKNIFLVVDIDYKKGVIWVEELLGESVMDCYRTDLVYCTT